VGLPAPSLSGILIDHSFDLIHPTGCLVGVCEYMRERVSTELSSGHAYISVMRWVQNSLFRDKILNALLRDGPNKLVNRFTILKGNDSGESSDLVCKSERHVVL